jgi:hypothetical protein
LRGAVAARFVVQARRTAVVGLLGIHLGAAVGAGQVECHQTMMAVSVA